MANSSNNNKEFYDGIFSIFNSDFGVTRLVKSYHEDLPKENKNNLKELIDKNYVANNWIDEEKHYNSVHVQNVENRSSAVKCCFLFKLAYIAYRLNGKSGKSGNNINLDSETFKVVEKQKNEPSTDINKENIEETALWNQLHKKYYFDKLLALCFVHVDKEILDNYDTNAEPIYYMSFDNAGKLRFYASDNSSVLNLGDVCNKDTCKNLYLLAHLDSKSLGIDDKLNNVFNKYTEEDPKLELSKNKYFARLFLQFINYRLNYNGNKYYYLSYSSSDYTDNDLVKKFLNGVKTIEKQNFINYCVETANNSIRETYTVSQKGLILNVNEDPKVSFNKEKYPFIQFIQSGGNMSDLVSKLENYVKSSGYKLSEKTKNSILKKQDALSKTQDAQNISNKFLYAIITALNLDKALITKEPTRKSKDGVVVSDAEVNALIRYYDNLETRNDNIINNINKRVEAALKNMK